MNRSVLVGAATWLLAAGVLAPGATSRAGPLDPQDVEFRIDASSGVVGDELQLQPTLVENPDGTFSAVGEGQTSSYRLVFDLVLDADPALSARSC